MPAKSKSKRPLKRRRGSRPPFTDEAVAQIRTALLGHFDAHRRDLPWRADQDPYRVWVSEVMLQQTRVDTVRPYYDRWMQLFPSVQVLADAPLDVVLKSWEGLGYYSRARNLHRAARDVCERYNGALPNDATALRTLHGVGEYTAGALASIAFSQREPVVDGNVRRVLHRLLDAPRLAAAETRAAAELLVPAERPGDFNQALMELGALICTPRAPVCDECPLHAHCAAYAHGTQLERPAARVHKPIPDRRYQTLVLIDATERVLLRKRSAEGLLGGLWEFPLTDNDLVTFAEAFASRPVQLAAVGTITHVFSHFRAHYEVYRAKIERKAKAPRDAALRWASVTDLDTLALPTAQRRIARLALP